MTDAEVIDAVKEWANCHYADVDGDGDIWIADPQRGHWLSADERKRFFTWLEDK